MKIIINEIIANLTSKLLKICVTEKSAQAESLWMLEKLLGKTQAELIKEKEIELTFEQEKKLNEWIKLRIEKNKPLQYILGTVPFLNLEILVKPPILIPRPETEEWCAWLIEKLKIVRDEKIKILDVGAGSGCIALALAKALPYSNVVGVDINPDAINLCKKNKEHNKIKNAIFLKSDIYQELSQHKKSFDLIVSNPPYIPEDEYTTLSKQVVDWEDKKALVSSENGLMAHKKIVAEAKAYLKPDGPLGAKNLPSIVIEFGKGQEEPLEELFEKAGFENIEIHRDLEGVDRWIAGNQKA